MDKVGEEKQKDTSLVQSIERALVLLEALAEQRRGLGLAELSECVNLHASTAHRILATLVAHGYVRQDRNTRAYLLGFNLLGLGEAALTQLDIRDEVSADMNIMANEIKELVNLVVPDGNQVRYIAQANGRPNEPVQMFTKLGATVPLYCTAVGKAILSFLPENEIEKYLEDEHFVAYTDHTITTGKKLRRELEQIRQQGYAIDNQERALGVCCVASSIKDSTGRPIAALGISGPSGRFTLELARDLGPKVSRLTEEISNRLGYQSHKSSRDGCV